MAQFQQRLLTGAEMLADIAILFSRLKQAREVQHERRQSQPTHPGGSGFWDIAQY